MKKATNPTPNARLNNVFPPTASVPCGLPALLVDQAEAFEVAAVDAADAIDEAIEAADDTEAAEEAGAEADEDIDAAGEGIVAAIVPEDEDIIEVGAKALLEDSLLPELPPATTTPPTTVDEPWEDVALMAFLR
jgi:hypothetical protein